MSENKIDKGRIQAATSRNNKSRLLGTGIIASMLILSIVVLSTMQGQLSSKVAYAQATPFSDTFKKVTKNFQTFPQPNANNTLITANASKALFEPAAGLSNVFGPAGLFPFKDTFNCANALTCGVSAGNNSKFIGIFDQGNKHNMTGYEATYTSPVTYGPEQIKGHTYKITLTDTQWNSPDAAKPTRQAEFAQMVNNVGFNQIQHGASHVDRSDVPQLFDNAFLYGHAKVTDTTNGNNTVVAKDIFTHVMVAHVMNENTYYRSLKDSAQSPTLVFLFAINIPSDVALPGVGKLTPDKAQSFTPLSTDVSMKYPPQFTYSVKVPAPRSGSIKAPDSQSTTWPVDNPKQPLLFTFLVYQKVK
ncbi:MAG: hypothetical protein WCF06_15325 [Nitrososphaeraceae archaeon]